MSDFCISLTLEMTVFSARPLLIAKAIAKGVVSQLVPSLTAPSGSVMVMGSRGAAVKHKEHYRQLQK
jgi:hypothetical protein